MKQTTLQTSTVSRMPTASGGIFHGVKMYEAPAMEQVFRGRKSARTRLRRLPVLDVGIDVGSPQDFLGELDRISDHRRSAYVCFVNVHMLMEASWNPDFLDVVTQADMLCPDGVPIVYSLFLLHGRRQKRIAGPDMLPDLMRLAFEKGKRVFVLGSTREVLAAFELNARRMFGDDLVVGTDSPPFRDMTPEEDEALVQKINRSGADIIFVALGCPKQEKWMAAHRGRVHGCMYSVGYAVPVYAGLAKRAPKWMRDYCLEWMFRLFLNPRRLFHRYMRTNIAFMSRVIVAIIRRGFLGAISS